MYITIVTSGSRGDVQPYVALGVGLKRAGHEVCMPVPKIFRELVEENGLIYQETISVDPQAFMKRPAMIDAAKSKNPLRLLTVMFREAKPLIGEFVKEKWKVCQGSDLIISTMVCFGAYDSAEKLGIPCLHTLLVPAYPTKYFPCLGMPSFFNIGSFNKLTYTLLEQLLWQPFRSFVNRWRIEELGLKPLPFSGPYKKIYHGSTPVLFGYSPTVNPAPPDYPDTINVTGYWFLDNTDHWQAPTGLEEFINSGRKPIYIGFGSMQEESSKKITAIVLDALKICGQRCVLFNGWNNIGNDHLPDTIFPVGSVPHSWLFKRMAAVVHHGGAGTTAEGLRSGVPSIITPFTGDQPYWGKIVYQFGVGPKPVSYHELTAEKLADMINTAINDKNMQQKAKEIGNKIESESGVKKAVDIINNFIDQMQKK